MQCQCLRGVSSPSEMKRFTMYLDNRELNVEVNVCMLKFFREIKSIGCACVCVHGLEQGIDSHNYGD